MLCELIAAKADLTRHILIILFYSSWFTLFSHNIIYAYRSSVFADKKIVPYTIRGDESASKMKYVYTILVIDWNYD